MSAAPNPRPTQETTENNGSGDEYNSSGDEYKYPKEIAAEQQEQVAKDNLKEFMEETRHEGLGGWEVWLGLGRGHAAGGAHLREICCMQSMQPNLRPLDLAWG